MTDLQALRGLKHSKENFNRDVFRAAQQIESALEDSDAQLQQDAWAFCLSNDINIPFALKRLLRAVYQAVKVVQTQPVVCVVGPLNVGKSSLINFLSQADDHYPPADPFGREFKNWVSGLLSAEQRHLPHSFVSSIISASDHQDYVYCDTPGYFPENVSAPRTRLNVFLPLLLATEVRALMVVLDYESFQDQLSSSYYYLSAIMGLELDLVFHPLFVITNAPKDTSKLQFLEKIGGWLQSEKGQPDMIQRLLMLIFRSDSIYVFTENHADNREFSCESTQENYKVTYLSYRGQPGFAKVSFYLPKREFPENQRDIEDYQAEIDANTAKLEAIKAQIQVFEDEYRVQESKWDALAKTADMRVAERNVLKMNEQALLETLLSSLASVECLREQLHLECRALPQKARVVQEVLQMMREIVRTTGLPVDALEGAISNIQECCEKDEQPSLTVFAGYGPFFGAAASSSAVSAHRFTPQH